MEKYLEWKPLSEKRIERGIITGCDRELEICLPWWLKTLRKHTDLPVCFIDYDLSPLAKRWCEKNGQIISLDIPIQQFEKRLKLTKELLLEKGTDNDFFLHQKKRLSWFYKPFALLLTPFEETLWLDVDCEVLKDPTPLFSFIVNDNALSLSSSPEYKLKKKIEKDKILNPGDRAYNSGVIPFHFGNTLIPAWAKATLEREGNFLGDQDILNRIINDLKVEILELPKEYNWRVLHWGKNENATILHWSGATKQEIIHRIQFSKEWRFKI